MNPPEDDTKKTPPEAGSLEDNSTDQNNEPDSLETNSLETSSDNPGDNSNKSPGSVSTEPKKSDKPKNPNKNGLFEKVKALIKRFDIYLLIFILITIVALIAAGVALNRNNTKTPTTSSQALSQSALSQLNSNDTQVGGSQQTLNIESNTVFASGVLVKGSLEVAGTLKIAGALSLPGITVSGTTDLDQVNASSLTLSGNETVNGSLTVKQNLTVSGAGLFSGNLSAPQLTVSTLQVNGEIQVSHHITTTGSLPRASGGSLGSGGTSSVSGTDTAGTININIGGTISGGCLTTITYAQAYGTTPHVVVTPVGSAAANIGYYINSSAGSFSLCAANSASGSFSFNYIVID